MTFRQFLKAIQKEETPEADFANDFLTDPRMKGKTFKTWKELESELYCRACWAALDAGKSSMKRWRSIR